MKLTNIVNRIINENDNPIKITKISLDVESIKNGVSLIVKFEGNWNSQSDVNIKDVSAVLFDKSTKAGKDFEKQLSKFKGKSISVNDESGRETSKKINIPIPKSYRDFTDWQLNYYPIYIIASSK